MIDSKQRLWIISLGSEIDCLNLINNRFSINKQFFPKESLQQTIRISNIFEDSKSRIWLTTFGKGLYMLNEKTNRFEEFANESNGLISDFCFDIKEGLNSNLVVFESNGLTIIDVENFKFTHFPKNQLPSDKIMTEINEYYIDSEANIFIGTMNGIVLLNQIDLPSEITQSKLFFSHLYLNSEEVFPNDGSNILTQALPYCSKIRFSSKNRNFDIDISNTNYLKINGSQIEYILDGFEKQWNKTTSNRIHYTNIKPGNYVLKVRLFNTKSNLQNEISLPVEIYPPFYASTFAYILYFLLLALIAVYILRIVESKRLLKHSLEFEKKEKQRIEELDNAKVKFYINISHEFRTPISLIKAQIETILDNQNNLNPLFKSALQRVLKNTDRLQNLVSEILDFRKLELGKMKLKINRCNIIEQLAEAIDTFKEGINRNGIKLRFENSKTELFLYLDVKLIMSAINNLLNNAFKFTLENGEVIVSVEEDSENVYIHFSDTGIGIPEEHIDKVFDRFYQAPNATTNFGSGIGLSFVKDIVENHGGEITVRNNDNSGCKFTLKFRKGFEHFSANDLSPEVLYPEVEGGTILFENEQIDIEPSIVDNENSILIVEDNKEMLNLLAEIFSPLYQVKTAEDGEVAIEILKTIQPDLILSDVMMTKVSGIELCSYVKSNYEYCHIPVVLLTAKNLDENKIEGLQTGADDYIVKPFNTKLLITRCNNIINNRKILQEKFAKQIDYSPKIVATNEFDVKFINQAYEVIEKNLANFDFDVDVFCKEMYMSRVKLYNKIQGLTGMTIKDFIQNIKLKKAADYLVNRPDLLITDITYMLGFSSPRYFSKSFKGLFGIIPSEYRQKHNIKSDEEIVE
jgi:signal transduction histidine kinase/CheY-like chemotaxis protein/AraC-like DNA-binding protein